MQGGVFLQVFRVYIPKLLCAIHLIIGIPYIKTAESKPAKEKPSSADTSNGATSEEMIRMNLERLKKRAAPKQQKAPTSRCVNLIICKAAKTKSC